MDKKKADNKDTKKKDKGFWATIGVSTLAASLCCLSPLLLFVFGLSGLAFASSLADTLYGTYKWVFRGVGLLLLLVGLGIYFYKKGVCTLDAVKRRRREIINKVLIALFVAVIGYILFLYVIVHYAGVWLGLW